MHDWNVVVTVHEGGFREAFRLLAEFGPVSKTEFFNTLVMRVEEIPQTLENLRARSLGEPDSVRFLGRFMPVSQTFGFQSPAEFEARTRAIVSAWVEELVGRSFHVRMHRRGFKGRLSSMDEERFLDDFLLHLLAEAGSPGRVTFAEPDIIIAAETVGTRGGLSLWRRAEVVRYPFLRLD
jgi:hypothetical protein